MLTTSQSSECICRNITLHETLQLFQEHGLHNTVLPASHPSAVSNRDAARILRTCLVKTAHCVGMQVPRTAGSSSYGDQGFRLHRGQQASMPVSCCLWCVLRCACT